MARILVTDDSTFIRRRTCTILNRTGHEIIEATNGNHCLEIMQQDKPDLLFLDLVMPGLDGFGVLKTLQDAGNTIPVIVLTADIQDAVRDECMQLGAHTFLNKPPAEAAVLAALTDALAEGERKA
ncbi:response regulator [Mariprofundus erugo]|uniref:Response regulator n=1 Tax=Mariprofundus erugo TaxID=2528639 RepID=A0A5R9GTL4_9PROT|nr:response regulator [Mariprofundus erugo]TLS69200.1 response regulator [Mariprofundus erugo]TLS75034.1 response regulator [Mariprofundus erugo]